MRARLLTIGLLAVLVLLLAVEIPFGVVLAKNEQTQVASVDRAFASEIGSTLGIPLRARLMETLHQEAQQYATSNKAVLVFDREMRQVARSNNWENLQLSGGDLANIRRVTIGQRNTASVDGLLPSKPFVVAAPIRVGEETVGAVVVLRDTKALRRRILMRWFFLLLGAVFIMGLTAAVAVPVASWILHPIGSLSEAIKRLGEGASPNRLDAIAGPPELRSVASQFNDMADSVQEGIERQRAFVADASHQIRNPLTALRLRVENLEHHIQPSGRATLDRAINDLERIGDLVNQLLLLAKAESDLQNNPNVLNVNVSEILRSRCEDWDRVLQANSHRSIQLKLELLSPLQAVARDGALEQILDVLIDNAIKFSPPNGEIRVTLVPRGPFVDIHVIDQGPGMTADERARATDRFWRGPQTQHIAGTGLGLSIANLLARSCGGSLELRSHDHGGLDACVRLAST
jgi:signal transduction histidine kinase